MKSEAVFVLEHAGWPALLVDGSGTIHHATEAAVKTFGPALEGASPRLSALWPPDNDSTVEQFLAQWERAPAASTELRLRIKGGSVHAFNASICAFSGDAQKFFVIQLLPETAASAGDARGQSPELSLVQKQKLECALQLARTVSLDFNNALTSILGHTSLLLGQMEPNHPWRVSLMEVEKSAAKAAEIANDLGAFSRQEKEPRSQATGNLNSILQRSVEVLQKSKNRRIEWTLQLERKLFATKFDEAKIQQAFVKVLENAVQAIEDSGRILIQSHNVELREPGQDQDLQLGAGTYVCIETTDDGCGIAPDVLPRIFEPFFTTKKEGNHRGLGLAWVYGIVTNHGGGVAVSSKESVGTSVRIYLPAEKKIARDSTADSSNLNGTQTVLMVDDEDLLLTMGQTVLSAFGYTVLTANSGQKALEILAENTSQVDLLITDMVMPTMSGRELVEHAQRLSPHTRIMCTSGFVRPSGESDDAIYLQKPYTSQDLLVKVKSALSN
jgi:signal transduction histidine kinase/CheY-like chemotaxis protein